MAAALKTLADRVVSSRRVRRLGLLGLLALAGCADVWPAEGPADVPVTSALEANLARGRDRFAAGHYGLAAAAFRDAVERDPNSIGGLNGLAAAYDRIGRYDLAVQHYQRALKLAPESAQTLNNMGFSYMLQGKFDLAAVYLRDAQQHDRNDPAIAANRAVAEAALRASRPRPGAQWQPPADKEIGPLPGAWLERATPIVQTLFTRASLPPAVVEGRADTLPGQRAAPIGDTRLAADRDRLPHPLAAAMTDTGPAEWPIIANGGMHDEPPG